jgi:hypothetical protein
MDDVRGWGGGERRQGGGERLPGLLEVSSRLSIVEGVGDGNYCTSRDGGQRSVVASELHVATGASKRR